MKKQPEVSVETAKALAPKPGIKPDKTRKPSTVAVEHPEPAKEEAPATVSSTKQVGASSGATKKGRTRKRKGGRI